MLTAQETDQLVHDIQREFPLFTVGERRDDGSDSYVVTVRDPTSENEVIISTFASDWRDRVVDMMKLHKPARLGPGLII
jgi:hypothetical protein